MGTVTHLRNCGARSKQCLKIMREIETMRKQWQHHGCTYQPVLPPPPFLLTAPPLPSSSSLCLETGSHYVANTGLKLTILLLQ